MTSTTATTVQAERRFYVCIDPHDRHVSLGPYPTPEEREGEGNLDIMRRIIGAEERLPCALVDYAPLMPLHATGVSADLWVDDEGMDRNGQSYFTLNGSMFAGRAIILASNDEGETIPLLEVEALALVRAIRAMVAWNGQNVEIH